VAGRADAAVNEFSQIAPVSFRPGLGGHDPTG
jgi:hypothetical protein